VKPPAKGDLKMTTKTLLAQTTVVDTLEIRSLAVHANGIRQHYLEAGGGPTVVLLHGFPETSYAWRHQIPVLAEHYRVIVPDLRGYGETEKPAFGYDKRTMANDLRQLMRVLHISKIALVGHDRGARVATRLSQGPPGRNRPAGGDGQRPHAYRRARLRRAKGEGLLVLSSPTCPRRSSPGGRLSGYGTSFRIGATFSACLQQAA
jgi:pimeloyl-ACP methyl ester carboxylesterase